ncbi:MAG TPA: GNAT family N-acetyltransferase [Flavitalea sp.]|nr:GNAT family N-acetyltransferase [Flavitalea sp.]
MEHVLDNPIWNGLNSGNRHLGEGNDYVKLFPVEISIFVGLRDFSHENYMDLYEKLPSQSVRATFAPHQVIVPQPLEFAGGTEIYQMVHDKPVEIIEQDPGIIPLNKTHIAEMLALTKLTNPGPFNSRTIEFGNFHGIFRNSQLVAMAGQRLKVFQYTEVSAVCTHPDHVGNGYARRLLLHQINMIRQQSDVPILHVKTDNQVAIKLYESVGFSIRRELNVVIFKKT